MNDQPLEDANLRALAQQLGVRGAERVDPERTAQAVIRRLREPQTATSQRYPLWLAAAATIVLLLGGSVIWRNVQRGRTAPVTVGQTGPDLNDLSADQLRDVLNAVDQPFDVEQTGFPEPGLDDLTPGELRTLLRALEG